MYYLKNFKFAIGALILCFVGFISFRYVYGAYLTTNRDTKLPPDKVTYDIVTFDDYELIYESNTMEYYFREDRDIFAIKDKRTGYVWKTGIDVPFNADIDAKIADATTKEEIEKAAVKQEAKMNSTYLGIANSLISVEYYEAETIKNISSASKEGASSTLYTLNDNPATRRLDIKFSNLNLEVKVHITFEDDRITYDIKDEDVTGDGRKSLLSINISPFLGASGGKNKLYNTETEMYDIEESKYMVPGYIFVPDGSGSLIRFNDNSATFSTYIGDVYGPDYTQGTYYGSMYGDAVPIKNPVMPVFGIAHGNKQAAFVAYASSGAEYMEIVVRPEENMTYYNWAYPRFVYNTNYFQVYNNKGEGFFTLMEEGNKFDITMTYVFLAGDGSDGTMSADYTGMAKTYRKHLIDTGVLTVKEDTGKEIPLRIDFIMSDSKKGIVGTDEVVVTTTKDVDNILDSIMKEYGINNINTGLYGWQKGGEILTKPGELKYSRKVGTKKEFKELIKKYSDKDVDVSYAREYASINKEMTSYYKTAARHVNSLYLLIEKYMILPANYPITQFSYATTKKSVEWFLDNVKEFSTYSSSMTVGGITNVLLSTYGSDAIESTLSENMLRYQEALENANKTVKLNMENPNMYLWKYTDRYLQSPVGTSQYVFETDAVPFLQIVLNGTMEVYAPYSNFSFYTKSDMLRMIDYNISPSFIISKEPSYYLAPTASSYLYSTEYSQYKELIDEVYDTVNDVLKSVIGYEWVDRTVLKDGVIINTYKNGNDVKEIIINYTDEVITYNQQTVEPLSAELV